MSRKILVAALALASFAAAPAFAAPAPYVSVAVGGSNADIDCAGTDSCDKNALAAKVIGGYDFGNQFAVEAMYVSLGEPDGSVDGIKVGIQSSYWGLGGAFRPAINQQWSGVFRLGVAFTTSKANVSFNGASGSESFDSTNAYVGAGLAYALSKDLKIEADLDSTQISVGDSSNKSTARVIDYTIGLTYSF